MFTHFHDGTAVAYETQCPVCELKPGLPYPPTDETWEEIADHQLDHDPTPVQIRIRITLAVKRPKV